MARGIKREVNDEPACSTNGVRATSSVINASQRENTGNFINFNFTTEDRNDGAMFPETIPSILLHAS